MLKLMVHIVGWQALSQQNITSPRSYCSPNPINNGQGYSCSSRIHSVRRPQQCPTKCMVFSMDFTKKIRMNYKNVYGILHGFYR